MIQKFSTTINPIVVKELRSRMRGVRPFITLTIMLIVLAGITYGIYRLSLSVMSYYSGMPISPQIGQALFTLLAFLLLLFISIITPAVTASAISSEREQLTYEMLLSTPLPPAKILWGKLFSALSYVFLLILAAIPIFSLIFVFGGVTLRDMLKAIIVLIVVAVTLGVFGIFMSTLMHRSSRATVLSYIMLAIISIGSYVIFVIAGVIQNNIPPRWILAINPISILASALSGVSTNYNSILGIIPFLGGDLRTLAGDSIGLTHIPRPLYHYSVPLYGLLSILFYFGATRLVLPTKKWRLSQKEILLFLLSLLTLISVTLAGYYMTTASYELATFDTTNQAFFGGVMVEPAIPQIRMETAPRVEVTTIEIEDQESIATYTSIYSTAITAAVNQFSEERGTTPNSLYMVNTIIDTVDDQDITYSLAESIQVSILDTLVANYPNVTWVYDPNDVFNNPKMVVGPNDYVLNMGDIQWTNESEAHLYVTININGVVEQQSVFTFAVSDLGEWEIISTEKVFDAAETN